MKIKELFEDDKIDLSTDQGKLSWLWENMIRDSSILNYDWNVKNGKVHGKGDWRLSKSIFEIPFPIESIDGNFYVASNEIKNFKNFPKFVNGRLAISYCNALEDWSEMPACWHLQINDCKKLINLPAQVLQYLKNDLETLLYSSGYAESLVGFDKVTKGIKSITLRTRGIDEGGIGLLLVKDLIKLDAGGSNPLKLAAAFNIIQQYIGKPNQIYDCQAELIDNGLEQFTRI